MRAIGHGLGLLLAAALAAPALAADPAATAALLRDRALAGNAAYSIVEGLTTEIGQRLAATPAEARARDWMRAKMVALGLQKISVQPYAVPRWERGVETAEVVGDGPGAGQKLVLTALGHSGATPATGLVAEVVRFADLDALKSSPAGSLKGRIAFVDHMMMRAQDGSSYGYFGPIRRSGPAIAASKGAAAFLMRSLGTGIVRTPHTGKTETPEGAKPLPSAALSVPDAEQLTRLTQRGPVRLKLVLTPRFMGQGQSGNVIGEITGAGAPNEVILVGGHLDSWDLGTGAIDDAAGVAITLAAAKTIIDGIKDGSIARPRRTIRVVAFGDEESAGSLSGATYLRDHSGDVHMLTAESDFGADRVWQIAARVSPAGADTVKTLARVLGPLGVAVGRGPAHGGTDIAAIASGGAGVIDLGQDGTRYFDIHHTAEDTLDQVDPAQLTQNVAAWAAMLWLAADSAVDFRVAPGGGEEH